MSKWVSFLFVLSLFITCSKDKDDDPKEELQVFEFNDQEVLDKLPDGLKSSDNEQAQSVMDFIESALDWAEFESALEPPEDAIKVTEKSTRSTGTYKWTWNDGVRAMTMYWAYSEDAAKRYWKLQIQFGDGPKYSYIDVWETLDGKQGEVKYNFQWVCAYDEEITGCEDLFWVYTWNEDAQGNYTFNWYMESSDDQYTYYQKIEINLNADGSGTLNYYLLDGLVYHYEWDTLGNGSWVHHLGGTEYSGTWTI